MRQNVLLVNSGKVPPITRLEGRDDLRLVVLSEARNRELYAAGTDVRIVPDLGDFKAARMAALDVMREMDVDAIVSPSERSLQVAGYLRSYFGLPGTPYDVANRFSNKLVMKRELTAAGIPVAPFRPAFSLDDVPAAAEQLGWPVVVKPMLGAGSLNTFVLRSRPEFEHFSRSSRSAGLRESQVPLLVEAFVYMAGEYHCDGVVRDGAVIFASPSKYFTPLLGEMTGFSGSYILPESNAYRRDIELIHQRVVKALGLHSGVTHLELFEVGGSFLVGEVTCRLGGGGIVEAIGLQCGVDLWEAFIDVSLDRDPRCVRADRPGVIANADLPIRPGKVGRISGAAELRQIENVIDVQMRYREGDTITHFLDSSATTGIVFFELEREEDVQDRIERLKERYVLEILDV